MNFLQKSLSTLGLGLCVSAAAVTIDPATAQARQIGSPAFPVMCQVFDQDDIGTNFRATPNGRGVATHWNGTQLGSPMGTARDGQGRNWVQFAGFGWIIQTNTSCEVMS